MPRSPAPSLPVTLGNMRAQGVCSLSVSCWHCHHDAVLHADRWPDDMPVPSFGPRMMCTGCGIMGADQLESAPALNRSSFGLSEAPIDLSLPLSQYPVDQSGGVLSIAGPYSVCGVRF
jgi:hypothetical protein